MAKFKKIYVDRVEKNFNPYEDFALGPWCFNQIYEVNEIYNLKKKSHFD